MILETNASVPVNPEKRFTLPPRNMGLHGLIQWKYRAITQGNSINRFAR